MDPKCTRFEKEESVAKKNGPIAVHEATSYLKSIPFFFPPKEVFAPISHTYFRRANHYLKIRRTAKPRHAAGTCRADSCVAGQRVHESYMGIHSWTDTARARPFAGRGSG